MPSKCLQIIIVTNKIYVRTVCRYVCMYVFCMYVHKCVGLLSALRKKAQLQWSLRMMVCVACTDSVLVFTVIK